MNPLVVIMAHGKAQDTFNRHLPYWERWVRDVLVFSPANDVVRTNHAQLTFGTACHHGPESIRRFRHLLTCLSKSNFSEFVIHEYDSLSFDQDFPENLNGTLYSNEFSNSDRTFEGSRFFHPPLMFSRETLQTILAVGSGVPDTAEKGFWDRWLGLVADKAGIPTQCLNGFSRNTIEPTDLQSAIEARRAGAVHFHGIKNPIVLRTLAAQPVERQVAA